jgi:predicted HicB family RNase H-like nuclease
MATKQKATVQVRIYPDTHKRLKVKAARCRVSLAEMIDAESLGYDLQMAEEMSKKKNHEKNL